MEKNSEVDRRKRYGVGEACHHFFFVQHTIEFYLTPSQKGFIGDCSI
jgi:hypothetical protein